MKALGIIRLVVVCAALLLFGLLVFGPIIRAAAIPEYREMLLAHERLALARSQWLLPVWVFATITLLSVLLFALMCWLYIMLRLYYTRRMLEINQYQPVGTAGTGTTGAIGTETINLAKAVLGQSNAVMTLGEDALIRQLYEATDDQGRQRYSRNKIAGLLGGNKQEALARIKSALGEE